MNKSFSCSFDLSWSALITCLITCEGTVPTLGHWLLVESPGKLKNSVCEREREREREKERESGGE